MYSKLSSTRGDPVERIDLNFGRFENVDGNILFSLQASMYLALVPKTENSSSSASFHISLPSG